MVTTEPAVYTAPDLDAAAQHFNTEGYVVLRGLFPEDQLRVLDADLERQQARLLGGELPEQCGTVILDDPEAQIAGQPFAHYVCHVTEVSPVTDDAVHHPVLVDAISRLLGPDAWLLDYERFGVVYQDARPDSGSAYSRIGWHSDFQSGPHLSIWPSVAFTIHLDATSPQNGFLRVVPGSHLGETATMPLGFEKVRGEVALYCDRGDVLLHHDHLWHAAARATDDGPGAVRRHVRGGWYGGIPLERGHGLDDFVKNARR